MHYTIRGIPKQLDSELRRRARAARKSLNAAAIEALLRGVGLEGVRSEQRALGDVAGTWEEDPAIDRALGDFRRIDRKLWR